MPGRPSVPEPPTTTASGRRPSRPRTLGLVGLAALALIAAACSGPGHNGPAAPADAATTSSTAAPRHGSTSDSSGPWSWNQASGSALAIGGGPGATLSAVLPPGAGRGWLIAGSRPDPAEGTLPGRSGIAAPSGTAAGSGGTATVWTSSDAVHWKATALPGGAGGTVDGATTWRSTTVVIGTSGTGAARRAVAWLSNTRGTYSVVDVSTDPTASVEAVAGGALGLFAAGTVDGELELWYSTDGQRWSPLPNAVKAITASTDAHIVTLLATSGPVYAAGWARNGTEIDGALWSSGDGIHWGRVAAGGQSPFRGPGDHLIGGLAETGDGILAVGATRSGSTWWPASWLSPDGATWSPAEESFPLDGRPQPGSPGVVVRAVATPLTTTVPIGRTTPLSTTLVAVGGSDTAQRVWESSDGLHWTEIPLPAAAAHSPAWRATLVATDGSTTVVLDSDPGQAHVLTWSGGRWSEPTADAATFGPVGSTARPAVLVPTGAGDLLLGVNLSDPSQALGSDSVAAVFLTSRDGRHWTRLSSGVSIPDAAVTGVSGTGEDLIAVGTIHPATAPAPEVWSSTNGGRTWTPSSALTGATPGGASVAAIARIGTQWVAVGQGAQPAAGSPSGTTTGGLAIGWTSASGAAWAQSGLDPTPGLALEQPTGICTRGATTVVVGWTGQAATGTSATVWWSGDGTTWQAGTVAPAATTGAGESMEGCVATAQSFVAYGTAPGSDGQPEPALWTSPDGTNWTRSRIGGFGSATAYPIVSLATSARGWLAAAGPTTADLTARPPMAAVSIPPEAPTELWTSTDGSAWAPIETGFPPTGHEAAGGGTAGGGAAIDQPAGDQPATGASVSEALADSGYEVDQLAVTGDTAVAAGVVEGGLAIWWGRPTGATTSTGTE